MNFFKEGLDEEALLTLAGTLAQFSEKDLVIFLHGELGAGKTTFSRGFLRGLGYSGIVKSPTYPLVEPYTLAAFTLYHFDFYRVHDPYELELMGIQDYFATGAIVLIEWPEQGGTLLPPPDLSCYIEEWLGKRNVRLNAFTPKGEKMLSLFIEHFK